MIASRMSSEFHAAPDLQLRGRSTIESYIPTLAARLTRKRIRARGQVAGSIVKDMPEVLFVSLHGTGRSQIAAALAESYASGGLNAHTAGSGQFAEIEPNLVTAMQEIGIDLEGAFSRPLTQEVLDTADVIARWAAASARCPSPPAPTTATGESATRRVRASTRSATSGTTSRVACRRSWTSLRAAGPRSDRRGRAARDQQLRTTSVLTVPIEKAA